MHNYKLVGGANLPMCGLFLLVFFLIAKVIYLMKHTIKAQGGPRKVESNTKEIPGAGDKNKPHAPSTTAEKRNRHRQKNSTATSTPACTRKTQQQRRKQPTPHLSFKTIPRVPTPLIK
jgi:hypothetical protein